MLHSYPALGKRLEEESAKSTPDEVLISHLKAVILAVDRLQGDPLRTFHDELKP